MFAAARRPYLAGLLSLLSLALNPSGSAIAQAAPPAIPSPGQSLPLDQASPVDLAGYKLGMSLDEFKSLPLIDRVKYPKARVLCSGDPELRRSTELGTMRQMPDERAANIIRCNIFRPDPSNVSWWSSLPPARDGRTAKESKYYFASINGAYRLLFAQSSWPQDMLQHMLGELVATYGAPAGPRQQRRDSLRTYETRSWQTAKTWLVLDYKTDKAARAFTVTIVDPFLDQAVHARGFNSRGTLLYYSTFVHMR
ncbi:hypothetical protein ACFPL7_21205 [Dongia soli]|uniref:Uncharacterized protein n=1 Tax=Dongia soli TaxID=600628 RepID=A0ABU5E933_9PROT|nr:hypothetical protein [Dongia soli]MDY0882110.1 hypothetical protein [Dongia soli]